MLDGPVTKGGHNMTSVGFSETQNLKGRFGYCVRNQSTLFRDNF